MELSRALAIFELNDISNETEYTLKLRYRQQTKKYHPDNLKTGDEKKFIEIKSAFELLKETIKKIELYRSINIEKALITIVIPMNKLIHLYEGGSIEMGSEHTITVDKKVMKQNNTLIIVEALIESNNEKYNFENIQPWNYNDNYEIHCDLPVKNISESNKIKIKVLDKELSIDMQSKSLSINFSLLFNIKVNVYVHKKIVD